MNELALQQPELIGREDELDKLSRSLDNAIEGNGSTIFIGGEAGIGKTRLVCELMKDAESKGVHMIQGWCLAESLEPLMPIKTALREARMFHLVSGDPPPKVVSAYLIDDAGMLMNKAEREESGLDPDIFASMLQAVGNFIKDSLSMMDSDSGAHLHSLGYGEYTILLQSHGTLSLVTVIKGTNSEFLIDDMKQVLAETGSKFDDWSGDISKTEELQPKISWFVDSGKYDGRFLVDDAKIKQENLFDNILLGIQRASLEKPVLLFLDDLQWSDPSSLNLIHYLARNSRNNRVLILGTYRPEDILEAHDGKTHQLEIALQGMSREDLLHKMELKRLGPEETKRIVESMLGQTAFEKDFFDKIFKDTDGSPFFILEVIKMLAEDKAIEQDEDAWRLKKELDEIDVPSKVYDVVKRRLDRLMKEQRRMLDCASVVGQEFQSEIVGRVMGVNKLQLLENLSEIEKVHRLIHYLKDKYKFDHAKIQEVLYNSIGEELRKEYHKIIADTIVELHEDNPDDVVNELAYHYCEARDERAGGYLVMAGDKAKEEFANEESIKLYANAVVLIKNEERVEVLEKLGDVQSLIGDFDKAIENFEKAKGTAEDKETKARMLRKSSDVYERMGEYDKSLELLARAKKLIEEGMAEYGKICFGEGYVHWKKGDYDNGLPLFRTALKIFEETGDDQKDIGNALRAVGNIHTSKGGYDEGVQYYEKSLAVMEKIGDQYGIATALNNIGIVHKHKGEFDRALEFQERSLEILEKIGDKQGIAMSLYNIGVAHYEKGEPVSVLEFYGRSLEILEKIGDKQGIAMSLYNIGVVYHDRGELEKALEFHERGLEILEKIGDKWGIMISLSNSAAVYHDRGELEKALEFYERGLEICLEIGEKRVSIHHHCGLAEVKLEMGDVQIAFEHAEKAIRVAIDIGAKSEEGMSHRVLGMVYREKKDRDNAIEEFEKARIILDEFGEKIELAKVFYEHGLLFKVKGEPAKAREYLKKAHSEFERMGMKLREEKCRKALGELEG